MRNYIKKIESIIVVFILIISSIVLLFLAREFISNYAVRLNMTDISTPGTGSKVLVISPHNDDEVLGAGELIKKSVKNGADVKVVLVTNGDGYKRAIEYDYFNLHPKPADYIKFGYERQKESIKAVGTLGLPESNIIFLGYPDGGISYMWNSNWDKNEPFMSSFTQTDKSPYTNSFTKEATYAGESITADIIKIVSEYKPTHIVFPHPNDRHPDHWAVNAFIKYALTSIDYAPEKEWLYLVHRGDWPTPMKKNTNMFLVPPAKLINTGTNWFALNMDNNDINEKANAINSYKTQMRTLSLLMSSFERKNELFGEYNDIQIEKYKREDEQIQPELTNKIITDPLQDALGLQISKEADLSGVYAEISNSNKLHIFAETAGNADGRTKYNINMFFFIGSKSSRLNLDIENNKIAGIHTSRQSIPEIKDCSMELRGRYIHVVIPYNVIGPFSRMYINVSSSIQDHLIDKTAWRMVIN